jgi:hypothetical protein
MHVKTSPPTNTSAHHPRLHLHPSTSSRGRQTPSRKPLQASLHSFPEAGLATETRSLGSRRLARVLCRHRVLCSSPRWGSTYSTSSAMSRTRRRSSSSYGPFIAIAALKASQSPSRPRSLADDSPGVSLLTQALYALVFCSRYLDIFTSSATEDGWHKWNFTLKV